MSSGLGTVFKLTPPAAGQTQWTESVLYSFKGGSDGETPRAGLIFDTGGALYGTTSGGGQSGAGTVFKLTPPAPGQTQWTETVLYSFKNGNDGVGPAAGLIFDTFGALYGTTLAGGGPAFVGTVFKLTPPAAGQTQWTESVLHSFKGGSDGASPAAGLIFGAFGGLYGTTTFGGGAPIFCDPNGKCVCVGGIGCGTVFKLKPPAAGQTQWTEKVLHSFKGSDGASPEAGLIFDTRGALYGTTGNGGTLLNGTVFELH